MSLGLQAAVQRRRGSVSSARLAWHSMARHSLRMRFTLCHLRLLMQCTRCSAAAGP